VADLSREESKRLRAELAKGLGFYPASLPKTSPGTATRSRSARPERKPVSAMGGVQAATNGASGITSRKNGAAQRSKTQGRPSVADLYE
jgi:hypothetical protein